MDEIRAIDEPEVNVEVRHEESDVNVRAILWFLVIFLVVAAVLQFSLYLLFEFFVSQEKGRQKPPVSLVNTGQRRLPREPRLQPLASAHELNRGTPVDDMRAMRERQKQLLGSYGWVDRQKGSVRIPIEQAMRLTLQRGLQTQPAATVSTAGGIPATPAAGATPAGASPTLPSSASVQGGVTP